MQWTEADSVCLLFVCLSGGEQPIPLWNEHDTSTDAEKPKILLYSLSLMFKVCYNWQALMFVLF